MAPLASHRLADAWPEALGPVAGPYAESDKLAFALHQLDEQIHHGAEIAVLRDLWRGRATTRLL